MYFDFSLKAIIVIGLIAILIDGLKNALEIIGSYHKIVRPRLNHEEVTVIITAYNESERIVRVIHSARRFFKNVIVADDGSMDRTADIAKAVDPDIKVLYFDRRRIEYGLLIRF